MALHGTFLHTAGNGGWHPAYNVQLAADTGSRAITGVMVTNSGTDSGLSEPATGGLKDVSVSRLACLFRHWTWADEARTRFEQTVFVASTGLSVLSAVVFLIDRL